MLFDLSGEQLVTIARYIGAGLSMGLGAIGAAVGIGTAAGGALEGISRHPERQSTYIRTMFIGQAIAESTAVYSLVVAMVLLFVVGGGSPEGEGITGTDWVRAATFLAGGLTMGLGAIGGGIGSGPITQEAIRGSILRPELDGVLLRFMFLGQAVRESPSIYALVVSLILILVISPLAGTELLNGFDLTTIGRNLGAGIAMGAGAIGAAVGIGYTAARTLAGITRQPAKQASLVRTMFLSMAITESPAIYALVISMILLFAVGVPLQTNWTEGWVGLAKFLGSGIAIGFGAIGAAVGIGITGAGGLQGIARNPKKEGSLVRTMFIGMAVAESPAIYALVVSLILLFVINIPLDPNWQLTVHDFARLLGAGIAMGAGAIGPGLGIGLAARDALIGVARNPKQEGALVRTMFLGMAVTESTAIYALVIAMILLFVIN